MVGILCTMLDRTIDTNVTQMTNSTIWSLPQEVIYYILQHLHISDVLSFTQCHSSFSYVSSASSPLWATISFRDSWPNQENLHFYRRAGKRGNIEALVKLGLAFLYNEGFPYVCDKNEMEAKSAEASECLCCVEELTPNVGAFTWLFIRPPWSEMGACCKQWVFANMVKHCIQSMPKSPKVLLCISKVISLRSAPYPDAEAFHYLRSAATHHSCEAMLQLWQQTVDRYPIKLLDDVDKMMCTRELRSILRHSTNKYHNDVILALAQLYANGYFGGYTQEKAFHTTRQLYAMSKPSYTNTVYNNRQLSQNVRYILIDWMIEVANIRQFTTQAVHASISMVDRYLLLHPISRSQLQLVGVASMVICSRYFGGDIITIKEAVWLTDSTYKYEDVVKMMGEITATLKGSIKPMLLIDYLECLITLCKPRAGEKTEHVARYIAELVLLHSESGQYTNGELAACCMMLAHIQEYYRTHNIIYQWTPELEDGQYIWDQLAEAYTGYTRRHLALTALRLYSCIAGVSPVDHRLVKLEAVKVRYTEERFLSVAQDKMVPLELVESLLDPWIEWQAGTSSHTLISTRPNNMRSASPTEAIIMSPSRTKCKQDRTDIRVPRLEDLPTREHAATPSPQQPTSTVIDATSNICHNKVSTRASTQTENHTPVMSGRLPPLNASCDLQSLIDSSCPSSSENTAALHSSSSQKKRHLSDSTAAATTGHARKRSTCFTKLKIKDGSTQQVKPRCSNDSTVLVSSGNIEKPPAMKAHSSQSPNSSMLPASTYKKRTLAVQHGRQLTRSRSFTLSPRITPTSPTHAPISLSPNPGSAASFGSPSSIILSPVSDHIKPTSDLPSRRRAGPMRARRKCHLSPASGANRLPASTSSSKKSTCHHLSSAALPDEDVQDFTLVTNSEVASEINPL